MMEYLEKAVEGVKHLIPPPDGASDVHVRRWRTWIAMATFLNAVGLSAHIALACGFASPFYPGFAHAEDIVGVQTEMRLVKAELQNKRLKELTSLMLDTKQKQCVASGEVKRLYLVSYNDLRQEYFTLTQREFPDPPCSDFK